MSPDPRSMSHSAIIRKVLEVNPLLQIGTMSPGEMSAYLMASIRTARQPPKFSNEKFATAFTGMLVELEAALDRDLTRLADRKKAINETVEHTIVTMREAIVEFLVAAHVGPLNDALKGVLRRHENFLGQLEIPLPTLNRVVRERSNGNGGQYP